jgi:hypothetical protein
VLLANTKLVEQLEKLNSAEEAIVIVKDFDKSRA